MTTPTAAGKAPSPASSRSRRWSFWIATPVVIVALGMVGLTLQAPGLPIAWWWPAAGACAWFALRAKPGERRWALLATFVATSTSNALVGRPLSVALLYGFCNTMEVAVLLSVIGRHDGGFRLTTLTRAVRFVAASLIGAAVLGLTIAAAGSLLVGSSFPSVALVAFASHSSATMLIGALAVLPPREGRPPQAGELAAHAAVTVPTLLLTFGPGGATNLSFLVFAVLAAGCLRFPLRTAILQSLVISIAALLLALTAGGSFGFDLAESRIAPVDLVIFMSTVGVFTLLVSVARYESRMNANLALRAAEDVAQAERARVAALAAQLELQRQREDFATTTSHELRTPLTNIVGYTDLLLDTDLDDVQRGWIAKVRRGADRLTTLVDGLIESREASASDAVAVDPLMERVRAVFATDAAARHASIVTVASGLVARAAPIDVERALTYLVSNAVTFAENGTIAISASRIDDDVLITVTDDGPGMSPTTLQHAFDRFYRGPEAEGRGAGGLGLGLGSARDLARRNGGDVTLSSDVGHGVSAALRLPALTDGGAA
ncbi:sensor histidine kinase [Microbacterium sp. 11MF]|uniref:sensor histidine kinase n=1 Tax=Microbacterium sp. 11MF TaxID=1169146 RepID=UPI00037DB472|nr:ATP-binding protein [Microbacterium sp. 11MF]